MTSTRRLQIVYFLWLKIFRGKWPKAAGGWPPQALNQEKAYIRHLAQSGDSAAVLDRPLFFGEVG